MKLHLAVVTALLMIAPGALASHPVPVVNGDFGLDAAGWVLAGDAAIADGTAKLGTYSATCFGNEPNGISGSITTVVPPSFTSQLEFDYVLVQTLDNVRFSGVVVQAVGPTGQATTLATWNPNPDYGRCISASGHAVIGIPPVPPGSQLRIGVYQDAFGDPFFVELDNVQFTH